MGTADELADDRRSTRSSWTTARCCNSTAGSSPSRPRCMTRPPETFTTQTAPDSVFCSGVAELPDGRVLVVGGYGGLSTGQPRDRRHDDLRPGHQHLDARRRHALPALVPGPHRARRRALRRDQRQHHRRTATGPTRPRCSTRPRDSGPCSPGSRPPRSTRRSIRSRTCCPTATCSRSGRPRTSRSSSTSTPRRGRRSAARAAWSTAPRSCTGRARSSTAAARRPRTVARRPSHHGDDRPHRGDSDMAPDGADGPRPHLPHPHHARRRHGPGRRRRADRRADRQQRGLGRRAALGDLESRHPDLVPGGRDRSHARLPLDRDADARRDRAGRRQRPRQPWPRGQISRRSTPRPTCSRVRGRRSRSAPAGVTYGIDASTSRPPTPPRSARSTWSRWAPTRTRAIWASTSSRSASPRPAPR